MSDEIEVSGLDPCTWTNDPDEKRRAFIVNNFPWNPEVRADDQIWEMEAIFRWLKDGNVPGEKEPPKLKIVPPKDG